MEDPARTDAETELKAARQAADNARRAWAQAVEAIEAVSDTDAAWKLAGELGETVPDLQVAVGLLRARLATRIRIERQLSLARLAAHFGVSKSRAQSWVEAAHGRRMKTITPTRTNSDEAGREAGVPNSPEDR